MISEPTGSHINVNGYVGAVSRNAFSVDVDNSSLVTNVKMIEPGNDITPGFEFTADGSTDMSIFRMLDPGEFDNSLIEMSGGLTGGSIKMFNPQPEPPALMFDVDIDASSGPSMRFHNSFGPIMTAEQNMTGGFVIKMEDPEEEPVQMHVELGSSFSIPARRNMASDGGYLSLYSPTDYLQTHLTPGNLLMYYEADAIQGPPIYINTDNTGAQVGIGTNSPTEALYVMGNIYATGTITELSDAAAKSNVETIDNALDLVENLRGVRYNLESDIAVELNTSDDKQIGLIAQEVKEVLPEVVNSPEEGYSSVNYSRLTAVLIEAVKELKAENDDLKSRIERLEGK